MKTHPFEPSCFYHFYNRGNNRENIFKEETNYFFFLNLIKKYLLPIADIYSYCLLPNHFHLLLKIEDENLLPDKIHKGKSTIYQSFSNLFNAYTKAFIKQNNRSGSLFQKHPKKIKIENEKYLQNLIIYINTNPSHHCIADFSKYKFSSYLALLSKKPTYLIREEIICIFNDLENLIYVHQSKKNQIEIMEKLKLE